MNGSGLSKMVRLMSCVRTTANTEEKDVLNIVLLNATNVVVGPMQKSDLRQRVVKTEDLPERRCILLLLLVSSCIIEDYDISVMQRSAAVKRACLSCTV